MAEYEIGDLVVLKSGSMRMCVEGVGEDGVATVWCNEGAIGRDVFDPRLLNKWEYREDSGPRAPRGGDRGDRGGDREGGRGKPYGGDRDGGHRAGGGKPYGRSADRDRDRDRDRDDERPAKKTGWDGKPREKKYFRKDD